MRRFIVGLALAAVVPGRVAAQDGAIGGRVTESVTGTGIPDVSVLVDDSERGAVSDSGGYYRIRQVRAGTYTVRFRRIGYRSGVVRTVVVRAGETSRVDIALEARAVQLDELEFEAAVDSALDPLQVRTEQRITAADLRQLPVSSLDEAIDLSAGAVGTSYRGGRPGQQSFILDGLGVKNQLDASTNDIGIRIPPDILTEAALITNGFSARYGQAISGMINVVTRDGTPNWQGRIAYESDRYFGGTADHGLDRLVIAGEGPIVGRIRGVFGIDLNARVDFDPVSAPAPTDPLDPRTDQPSPLPHNAGEQLSFAGKLTIPITSRQTVRLFGLHSSQQQQLYDQLYKYDLQYAPVVNFQGTLASAAFQHVSGPTARTPLVLDVKAGYLNREFLRGQQSDSVDFVAGAFTFDKYHILGEDIARAKDSTAALSPIPGMYLPANSARTPWGVPAFFQTQNGRGDVVWNEFTELRGQVDATLGLGARTDLYFGGEYLSQHVQTFQRALGYLPVGDSVPPASASDFKPTAAAAYVEAQYRVQDLAFTGGLRYDRFDGRQDLGGDSTSKVQQALSPRIAVSTMVKGATIVASFGYFTQPPDYQFLVDAAFADTTRTGRFRVGNPNLGFERAWQFEFNVRARPRPELLVKTGIYAKRLYGLIASVPFGTNPDSAIFGNDDYGTVRGLEIIAERAIKGGWGARLLYTLQFADGSSSSPFLLRRLFTIDPVTGDTILPARVEFPLDYDRRHALTGIVQGIVPPDVGPRIGNAHPFAKWEMAGIVRLLSGLPYTSVSPPPDTLRGPPNDSRLPWTWTFDLLVRRPLQLGSLQGSIYFDVRNLFNVANIFSVRRDTGTPFANDATIAASADSAFLANPTPIPYESPHYRRYADLNGDGLVSGPEELIPLYRRAAADWYQPVFFYGPPRLMRIGMEILF